MRHGRGCGAAGPVGCPGDLPAVPPGPRAVRVRGGVVVLRPGAGLPEPAPPRTATRRRLISRLEHMRTARRRFAGHVRRGFPGRRGGEDHDPAGCIVLPGPKGAGKTTTAAGSGAGKTTLLGPPSGDDGSGVRGAGTAAKRSAAWPSCGAGCAAQACSPSAAMKQAEGAFDAASDRFDAASVPLTWPARSAPRRGEAGTRRQEHERAAAAADRLQRRVSELAGRLDRMAELAGSRAAGCYRSRRRIACEDGRLGPGRAAPSVGRIRPRRPALGHMSR